MRQGERWLQLERILQLDGFVHDQVVGGGVGVFAEVADAFELDLNYC
jgi:hypothetical protein